MGHWYTSGHQGTGPSMSVLPVVGIPVVRAAARGLQNWLAEGTDGSVLEPGATSVFEWQAGLLGSHLFSETALRDIQKWSWLSGFTWNIWAPRALPATLLSCSRVPGSVLSIILPGLRAVGPGKSSFVSCLGPLLWILSDLVLSILGSSVGKVTETALGI